MLSVFLMVCGPDDWFADACHDRNSQDDIVNHKLICRICYISPLDICMVMANVLMFDNNRLDQSRVPSWMRTIFTPIHVNRFQLISSETNLTIKKNKKTIFVWIEIFTISVCYSSRGIYCLQWQMTAAKHFVNGSSMKTSIACMYVWAGTCVLRVGIRDFMFVRSIKLM